MSFIDTLKQKIAELFGGAGLDITSVGDVVDQKVDVAVDTVAETVKGIAPDVIDPMIDAVAENVTGAASGVVDAVQAQAEQIMK
jgi:hypothetical protein